ncbi:MAG: twin-arginine translocase TatA/TatE family subunit [Anaerolineales bacterium]|nr:twin-arginine translocase TatA/TatE family subunit [Anaerolineales bacterium]
MELFGIGTTELLVIALLAAIVLGPQRLAVTAREAGKLIRNVKNYFRALSDDLGRELDILADLKDVERELRKP